MAVTESQLRAGRGAGRRGGVTLRRPAFVIWRGVTVFLLAIGLLSAVKPAFSQSASTNQAQTNAPGEKHDAYVLGTNGTLYMTVPEGWTNSFKHASGVGGLHDAIIFTPADTNEFNLLLVVFTVSDRHVGDAELKDSLAKSGERELAASVETSVALHDFKGGDAEGAYYRLTDRRLQGTKPAPGDFRYLTRGYAVMGPLLLTFELVSNDADRDEPVAIEALRGARFGR